MNPYAVLGVARDAPIDEIKKVYRRLARETHPDLNPGDAKAEARFKDISAAYDVLSDPEKRRQFDEFGEIALEANVQKRQARVLLLELHGVLQRLRHGSCSLRERRTCALSAQMGPLSSGQRWNTRR